MLENKNSFPKRISYFITYKCNFSCPYCYLPEEFFHKRKEKTVTEIIRAFQKIGIEQIDVLGGEPFLEQEKLNNFLTSCLNASIKIKSISTNGLIINNETLSLLETIKGVTVLVSLDAATPATYKIIRNSPYFFRVIENIKVLVERKIRVVLGFTITKDNFKEIGKFMTLARRLKVNGISVGSYIPVGRGQKIENRFLNNEEMIWIYNLIKKNKDLLNIYGIKEKGCPAGTEELAIIPNGDVYPCGLFINFKETKLGNIFDKEIDFSSHKYFSDLLKCEIPNRCLSCCLPSLCPGACKAFIYSKFRSFSSKSRKFIQYHKYPCKNL